MTDCHSQLMGRHWPNILCRHSFNSSKMRGLARCRKPKAREVPDGKSGSSAGSGRVAETSSKGYPCSAQILRSSPAGSKRFSVFIIPSGWFSFFHPSHHFWDKLCVMSTAVCSGLPAQIPFLSGDPISDALKRGSGRFSNYLIHVGN